eukprot:gene52962-72291_t
MPFSRVVRGCARNFAWLSLPLVAAQILNSLMPLRPRLNFCIPTVHAKFGVPLALLTGDALIVMAFEVLARAGVQDPARLPGLISCIARGVGAPYGIVAGQAWECETSAPFDAYHQAKTGALFVAATTAGALAAGADPAPWRAL